MGYKVQIERSPQPNVLCVIKQIVYHISETYEAQNYKIHSFIMQTAIGSWNRMGIGWGHGTMDRWQVHHRTMYSRFTPVDTLESPIYLRVHVFTLWEEAGEPGGNWCSERDNKENPRQKTSKVTNVKDKSGPFIPNTQKARWESSCCRRVTVIIHWDPVGTVAPGCYKRKNELKIFQWQKQGWLKAESFLCCHTLNI